MIEITPSATSQRHPFLPLLVRQHRWRSLDEPQPTSRDHRHDAEPDLDAGGKPCLVTLNPSKHSLDRRCDRSQTDARGHQIPIGHLGDIDALPTRGFVPWRLSDAGPVPARRQWSLPGRHP